MAARGLKIPRLSTARLRLEPLSMQHSDGMFQMWRNALVQQYSGPAVDEFGIDINLPARSAADSDRLIAFWLKAAEAIDWVEAPTQALFGRGDDLFEWFADAKVNGCYNAVDRHVEGGRGDQVAIIHDSPITGTQTKITYADLQTRVASLAGALLAQGVVKGDRVIIYMPMVPEALEAMLACARIGAVHSVVFGGFAANELAVRIDDCAPKAIIAASCGLEPGRVVEYKPLLDGAIELADHKPDVCIVLLVSGAMTLCITSLLC